MGSDSCSEQVILATAGYDHTIRFWQAHSAMCYRTVQHTDSQVNDLDITPDRQLLAAAGYQHIRMYELNTGKPNPVINYEGISKNVTAIGFNELTKWMYSGGEDGCARIWDLRARNIHCQRIFPANAPINCVCLHPNQVVLIIGDQSGVIHIWDLKTNRNKQLIPEVDSSIMHIDVDPEGNYMAAITNKGNCYIWSIIGSDADELMKLNLKTEIAAHQKYGLKCKFSPDSSLLATTSADSTVKIWKTADFSPFQELKTDAQRWVWDIDFSDDSQYAITASSDTTARLWNVDSGEVKKEYSGHQKAITCLAFRDGT